MKRGERRVGPMELNEADLRAVPDAGVLHELPSGISIVRRRKHEAIPGLLDLPREDQARKTDKVNGSKFLPGVTLRRIVEMTAEVLAENDVQPGRKGPYNKVFPEPIGISKGRPVRGLRVLLCLNGTLAHGVPVDENEL